MSAAPELDTEWMKFMSRISRKQNCDADDGDDSDSESNAECHPSSSVFSTTPTAAASAAAAAAAISTACGNKQKKSCISKKSQRRTYSFIDDDFIVGDAPRSSSSISSCGGVSVSSIRSKITPIYISTKTKIAYLNQPVNIYDIF